MQLIPETATRFGVVDSFDPEDNLQGGMRYLSSLLQTFGGDITLATAAYNAGEQAVQNYGGVPPYKETQDYVARIREYYQRQR
jgi:soluble lytic murein transglycosylase-like protein